MEELAVVAVQPVVSPGCVCVCVLHIRVCLLRFMANDRTNIFYIDIASG